MKTLVYKQTHIGDPTPGGIFGRFDCMGRVRNWNFEAVIGIGGVGLEPRTHNISGKITWVGINPNQRIVPGKRARVLTFEFFKLVSARGPHLIEVAPNLAKRMLEKNAPRATMKFSGIEQKEIEKILRLAEEFETEPVTRQVSRAFRSKGRSCNAKPK